MDTDIIKHQNIYEIINSYEQAVKEIVAAYELLYRAEDRLKIFCVYPKVLPRDGGGSLWDDTRKRVLNGIKSEAWQGILKKTRAVEFMTTKRYEKFQRDLEKPESLPDITFETVQRFIENILNSAPNMLLEFIKETFDWLRPGGWAVKEYKTNEKSKYELREKIIKSGVLEGRWSGGGCDLKYYYESNISAMDNAFSLMDGKGVSKGQATAITAIKAACQDNLMSAETEYFKFKWYQNGNLHLTFKRTDLVQKMNQIAGENLIKPSEEL